MLNVKFSKASSNLEKVNLKVEQIVQNNLQEIIKKEIKNIASKLNNCLAPGIDVINHKTLKILNILHPNLVVCLMIDMKSEFTGTGAQE